MSIRLFTCFGYGIGPSRTAPVITWQHPADSNVSEVNGAALPGCRRVLTLRKWWRDRVEVSDEPKGFYRRTQAGACPLPGVTGIPGGGYWSAPAARRGSDRGRHWRRPLAGTTGPASAVVVFGFVTTGFGLVTSVRAAAGAVLGAITCSIIGRSAGHLR